MQSRGEWTIFLWDRREQPLSYGAFFSTGWEQLYLSQCVTHFKLCSPLLPKKGFISYDLVSQPELFFCFSHTSCFGVHCDVYVNKSGTVIYTPLSGKSFLWLILGTRCPWQLLSLPLNFGGHVHTWTLWLRS